MNPLSSETAPFRLRFRGKRPKSGLQQPGPERRKIARRSRVRRPNDPVPEGGPESPPSSSAGAPSPVPAARISSTRRARHSARLSRITREDHPRQGPREQQTTRGRDRRAFTSRRLPAAVYSALIPLRSGGSLANRPSRGPAASPSREKRQDQFTQEVEHIEALITGTQSTLQSLPLCR